MSEFGAIYPCYNNKKATSFVLENFRRCFPNNPILLISDGGLDFSDVAEKYSCFYEWRDNIFGNSDNGYNKDFFNAARTKEWYSRHKRACDLCQTDYMMLLEDDVWIREPFKLTEPFALKGVRIGGSFPKNL